MPPSLILLGQPRWCPPQGQTQGEPQALRAERRLQLLALLGHEARWLARDELASLFWPDRTLGNARNNLRKVLHDLRRLGLDALEDGPAGLRWCPDSDVQQVRKACRDADWRAAARIGAGELMPGLSDAHSSPAFVDWWTTERQRWAQLWRDAALKAIGIVPADEAWALAEQLLARDTLDEEALGAAWRLARARGRPDLVQAYWQRYQTRLADELGLQPPQALQALARGETAPALAPLSPLVGRERELQELAALLGSNRLVTVLGPGGVGKTRLARQAADALAPRFVHGTAFVDLEDARTPDTLPARVAAALDGGPDGGAAGLGLAALGRQLATRSMLLVLDGFEGIIDAGPALLRLLAAAPGLHIVTTSRERLAVDGEWLLPLSGLAPPAPGSSAAELLGNEAVRLFLARARAVNPAFDAGAALAPVAAICRRLEGLPLALELAAAWVRLLPPADIARELALGLAWLDRGGGQALDAVFERSWQLLTPAEREALARLAVFRGGFTREAAREVAGVALPLLAALSDKCMLQALPGARLGLHALVHAQAQARLAARAESADLAEAHSRWFLALPRRRDADLVAESQNLLAAWQQAVARRDAVAVEAVLFLLPWTAMVQSHVADAAQLLADAASAFGAHTSTGALLRTHEAWMCLWLEQRQRAAATATAALAVLEQASHAAGTVMALRTLGHAARLEGDVTSATRDLSRGLAVARQARLAALAAVMQDGLAMALNQQGRHRQALAAVQAALPVNQALGEATQQMYNLFNLSQSHALAGDAERALPWAEQALQAAEATGSGFFAPYIHLLLASVLLALGRPLPARLQAQRARAQAQDHEDGAALASAHETLARIALAVGDLVEAREEIRSAARLCLARHNVIAGAALVVTAVRAYAPDARAPRWRQALLALKTVPEPVRREARALVLAMPSEVPKAPTLAGLLAEIAAA